MKFTTTLKLNKAQLDNLVHFASYKVLSRADDVTIIVLDGDKDSLKRILSTFADPLQQKIFAAKAALEDLIAEVQTHHGYKGHGTSKSVFIPLDLSLSDGDVCDHIGIYKNDDSKVEGLQVSSYEYDWIDEGQE